MKSLILILLSVLIGACNEDKQLNQPGGSIDKDKKEYMVKVEKMPMPVGGMQTILSKVVYPAEAKEKGIQGKVIVQAFVDSDGSVKIAEVLQGVNPLLDKAAVDAVKNVTFTPGYQDGKAVKTQIVIPIVFKLDGDSQEGVSATKKSGEYYQQADVMPEIIGGINSITKNFIYPESEKKAGNQGLVIVQLYIDEKGYVERKEIQKSVNPVLDKAALDALKDVKFTPGKVGGKPVKTSIALPVRFKLQ